MSTINLTLFNLLKTELKLSDEKAIQFVEALKEEQETSQKQHNQEFKSSIKEDLLKLELSLTKEVAETKSDLTKQITEQFKWFIGGFMAIVLMIIGLYFK